MKFTKICLSLALFFSVISFFARGQTINTDAINAFRQVVDRMKAGHGYLDQLIAGCDNPFHFFYLYNLAAAKDAEHPPLFSQKTMKGLHRLEKAAYR